MRFPRVRPPSQNVVRYLTVALALFAAVAALDARSSARTRVTDQNRIAVLVTCQQMNGLKLTLADLIRETAGPTPIPANADPALRAVIEQSNRRGEAALQRALDKVQPTNCIALVTDPSTTTTTGGL